MASVMGTLSTQDVVSHAFAKMLLSSERYRSEAQAQLEPGLRRRPVHRAEPARRAGIGALTDAVRGGGGARTFADGIDSGGIFHSMGSRMSNAETVEARVPVLAALPPRAVRRRRRRAASAAAPRSSSRSIPHKLPIDPAVCNTFASGVRVPAGRGLSGGHPERRPPT